MENEPLADFVDSERIKEETINLWRDAFHDSEDFMKLYFEEIYRPDINVVCQIDSYYVCNRKPGDGLIAPLRSIVFFRIEKRDEPLRYASRTLASLNAMKGGSGKNKSKKLAR